MNAKIVKFLKEAQERQEKKESIKNEALLIQTPVLLANKRDRGAIIHPSSKTVGSWQVSWWDARGFSGDTTRKTKEDAVKAAIDDGYMVIDQDKIFEKISMSASFLDGVMGLELARKKQEGNKGPWI